METRPERDGVVDGSASAGEELADEQRHLDASYRAIDAAIEALRGRLRPGAEGAGVDETAATFLSQEWARQLHGRLLRPGAPFFARIDRRDGATRHIGPHAVHDADGRLIVVNWRVPTAEPFYLATPAQPHGVARRRRFVIDDDERRVLAFEDELLDSDGPVRDVGLEAAISDVLQERAAQMRSIVATIRPDQYAVIQQPPEPPLFVLGGPGTGKSAVGLHRAAWLLYRDEQIARRGMLVVGPNRTFMDYIGVVLPYLGEESVEQRAVTDVPVVRSRRADPPELARLKGDLRMAELLRRTLWGAIRRPTEAADVPVGNTSVRVPVELVDAMLELAIDEQRPYAVARERFVRELRAELVQRMHGDQRFRALDPEDELSGNPQLQSLLARVWPTATGERVVHELLTNGRRLAEAADGVLSAAELELLRGARPRRRSGWATTSDAVLIDEAQALLQGPSRVFGHVVVDEVQDLTAMQLRMLARRANRVSMTLLGDFAQATSAAALPADGIGAALGGATIATATLELSYRVPREFLELAARLLPQIAPGVRPPRAIRDADEPIAIAAAPAGGAVATASELVAGLVPLTGSIGVVAPDALTGELLAELRERGVEAADLRERGLTARVSVAPATAMKGLEFDRVVVVEPAAIAAGEHGVNALYVALTRATRQLAIVHARPLPAALAQPAGSLPRAA